MKLPIRKKYFDLIKSGEKKIEYRDAHITFICEETGEKLRKDIVMVGRCPINHLPSSLISSNMFEDAKIIWFELK